MIQWLIKERMNNEWISFFADSFFAFFPLIKSVTLPPTGVTQILTTNTLTKIFIVFGYICLLLVTQLYVLSNQQTIEKLFGNKQYFLRVSKKYLLKICHFTLSSNEAVYLKTCFWKEIIISHWHSHLFKKTPDITNNSLIITPVKDTMSVHETAKHSL